MPKHVQKKKRPLLSIGMIVKNEIRCLERCLKSLQPLRDAISCQIVVADTGSTDGSREVAARYADIVIDFEWINDFAAARNAAMDRCTGIWYLSLDADEWMDENIQPLIDFMEGPPGRVYHNAYLCERNYVSDDLSHYTDSFTGRLIRMSTGLRYRGAIHETLIDPNAQAYVVQEVLLHHDGYIPAVFAGGKDKTKRNLELLREELAADPNNLMRVLQCIESSGTMEDVWRYVKMGIELSKSPEATTKVVSPSIYRHAVKAAENKGERELMREWLAEAEERFPDSIFVKVDAEAFGMQGFYAEQDYEAAARAGLRWEEGVKAYDAGGQARAELTIGTMMSLNDDHRTLLRCMLFESLCQCGKFEEASRTLERIEIKHLLGNNYTALVTTIFSFGVSLDNLEPQMQRLWDVTMELAEKKEPGFEANKSYLLSAINLQYSNAAQGKDLGIYHCFAALTGCEVGRSARILLCEDAAETERMLAEVEDWDEVLKVVYPRMMARGIELPPSFFMKPCEFREELAAELPAYDPNFTKTLLDYAIDRLEQFNIVQLNWILDLVISALRSEQWGDSVQCGALCALFSEVMAAYLEEVYRPEALREELLSILPGIYRFGWYFIEAQKALDGGDELGYVRFLHKGLLSAPAMKKMVEFLTEELKKRSLLLNPKMMELAREVKKKMEQMRAEGNPGLDELLESPTYRKLAPLIERIEEEEQCGSQS